MLKTKTAVAVSVGPLFEAGLTDKILREVVLRGEAARDNATAFDPPSRGGFDAWAEKVRGLREALVPAPLLWSFSNDCNLSLITTPDGLNSINVVSGDAFTGQYAHVPQPKYPRGEATVFRVHNSQGRLFERDNDPSKNLLWFLMVYRDVTLDHVRYELSLPEATTDEGFVTKWLVRYILEPTPLSGIPGTGDPDDGDPSIDVPVRRKT